MITTNEINRRRESVYRSALRGVSATGMVRLVAPVTAPMTGEVRPQAGDNRTAHLGNGIKDGVCVRTWSPPV